MSFVPWDWLPQDWLADPRFFTEDWRKNEIFQAAAVGEAYDDVVSSFDALLAEHGYEREGRFYRVRQGNDDVLAFICHFGLICVLLSHLFNCSPMVLWHGLALPPASVTTVHTGATPRYCGISCRICRGHLSSLCSGRGTFFFSPVLYEVRKRSAY